MSELSRRDFGKVVGTAAAAASLPASGGCERGEHEPAAANGTAHTARAAASANASDPWDRWRAKWTWDRVEVSNDVGRFLVRVKVSPAIRPGQVVMYHAWEDYQFEGGIGHRNVLATPLNPLGLAGGYPYLDATFGARQPGMNDRDTRVEIRRV